MFEPCPLGLGGGDGVIDMELLSVIRRWRFRDHFSIREISRRTGLSRNTVRRYLHSDSEEPKFSLPDRPSKLDPFADKDRVPRRGVAEGFSTTVSGMGRIGQMATAGNPTAASSLKVAMVSSVM
jgi:hypothetical protein